MAMSGTRRLRGSNGLSATLINKGRTRFWSLQERELIHRKGRFCRGPFPHGCAKKGRGWSRNSRLLRGIKAAAERLWFFSGKNNASKVESDADERRLTRIVIKASQLFITHQNPRSSAYISAPTRIYACPFFSGSPRSFLISSPSMVSFSNSAAASVLSLS